MLCPALCNRARGRYIHYRSRIKTGRLLRGCCCSVQTLELPSELGISGVDRNAHVVVRTPASPGGPNQILGLRQAEDIGAPAVRWKQMPRSTPLYQLFSDSIYSGPS